MPYEENRPRAEAAHHIILEEREQLSVSGVEEVESFDENTIVMSTVKGTLVVRGEDLHIEKLSLDGGDMKVEGSVDSLTYEDDRRGRGGLLSRLLGGGRWMWPPRGRLWSRRCCWDWPPGCCTTCSAFCGCGCASPCWARRWTCCSG